MFPPRRPPAWLAAGLLVPLLLTTGCGQRSSAVERGNREQVLHIGNLSEPSDLDPHVINSHQDANIVMALFEGLVQYHPRTAEPVPAIAQRWETTADNLTWTFHLRRDAKWSNGDPLTAHDFVFAYRRMLTPSLAAEYASLLYVLKNGYALNAGRLDDPARLGAHAGDDHTLVLTLEHPVPYLLTMLCHPSWYPVHRPTLEAHGGTERRGSAWTRPGNHVGNGCFALAEWRPHQFIRVEKNPHYWDHAQVRLNAAVFHPIESEDAEERAFRAGQLHVTSTLPISKIAVYRNQQSPFYEPHVFLATFFLLFNVDKQPLDDPRVRRALSLAIDRERFVRDVLKGGQVPAGHLTPPDTAGFNSRASVSYNLDAARTLLAEAGFPGGRGFPRLELLYNSTEANRLIAETLQQMWNKGLGIGITLQNQEARVQQVSLRSGDFQIARFAWVGDYLDPSTFLELMTGDSGNNMTRWRNAEYDRLFAEANRTADQTRRYELYQRLEEILTGESPIAPVYFYTRNNLRRPEVKGWYGNLLDNHPLKGVYLEPDAEVKTEAAQE
jgi:oligopeptide transport system substrate-binding protein